MGGDGDGVGELAAAYGAQEGDTECLGEVEVGLRSGFGTLLQQEACRAGVSGSNDAPWPRMRRLREALARSELPRRGAMK